MKYKVGDRVVVNGYCGAFGAKDGYKGTVKQVGSDTCSIHFDETICGWGDKGLEIPKNQGLFIPFEYLTLIEKEEGKMKAYDLMKLAAENPKEYEGKKYKAVSGSSLGDSSETIRTCVVAKGRICDMRHNAVPIWADTVLEEIIPKPVPFMEAVKAYSEGKKIRCEVVPSTTTQVYEYEPFGNGIELHGYELATYKGGGTPVTTKEILEGKWFIEG